MIIIFIWSSQFTTTVLRDHSETFKSPVRAFFNLSFSKSRQILFILKNKFFTMAPTNPEIFDFPGIMY